MRIAIIVLLVLSRAAHADEYGLLGPPQPFEPNVEPETARWIALGTTAAGLGLTAYLWQHAGELPEDNGRAEMQLASIGTGLFTVGLGPASGLLVAGERRRAVTGALTRPLLVGGGALAVGMGAFITMWGCFETNDCTGAKVTGGIFAGAGVAMAAGGIAWAAYEVWTTPAILRRRMPAREHRRAPARAAVAPLLGGDRIGLAIAIVH